MTKLRGGHRRRHLHTEETRLLDGGLNDFCFQL